MKEAAPNRAAFFVFINSLYEKYLKKKDRPFRQSLNLNGKSIPGMNNQVLHNCN